MTHSFDKETGSKLSIEDLPAGIRLLPENSFLLTDRAGPPADRQGEPPADRQGEPPAAYWQGKTLARGILDNLYNIGFI